MTTSPALNSSSVADTMRPVTTALSSKTLNARNESILFFSARLRLSEQGGDLFVAAHRRIHPRRALQPIGDVHVGAALQQDAHDVGIAGGGRLDERRPPVAVLGVD